MNRRQFFRTALGGAAGAALAAGCYGCFEAGWIQVDEIELAIPGLPTAFQGKRVAFLTDIHHGPYTDLNYLHSIVRTTQLGNPDLIVLGGDYCLRDAKYIAPCFDALGNLDAPMGVYGVLGNHDFRHGLSETRNCMKHAGVQELTNRGLVLHDRGDRFHLAGVDDLWTGEPRLKPALVNVKPGEKALVLSHNPDFCETLTDDRVGLVLSGHTHGGQVVFPGVSPFVPSFYGDKYLRGVVQAPTTTVFVSRGLGTSIFPARFGSRPEINFITLV
jgi:predicted MPP superfamily phosphohydrolase